MKRQSPYALSNRRVTKRPFGASVYRRKPATTLAVVPYTRIPSSVEKKYFDTAVTSVAPTQAGLIYSSLNLIPQGTTDRTRIGNKITITNVNIYGYANNDDLGTGIMSGSNVRIILFIDKQCNGAAATVLDLLTTQSIASFRNMDQIDRFVILKDHVLKIPITGGANGISTDGQRHFWKISKKLNLQIHFNSTTGALAEIRSNNIGLMYITDISTSNAAVIGNARVKFTDD